MFALYMLHIVRSKGSSSQGRVLRSLGQWHLWAVLPSGLELCVGQVLPALDPKTPVWAAGYTMQLLSRRMQEFGMWDPDRFHVFNMRQRFDLGPFEWAPPYCVTQASNCEATGQTAKPAV